MPWRWARIFRASKSMPFDPGLDLSFVTQERLRALLEDYWAQAIRANEARAHLGTVVACGALLEGLLVNLVVKRSDLRKILLVGSGPTAIGRPASLTSPDHRPG